MQQQLTQHHAHTATPSLKCAVVFQNTLQTYSHNPPHTPPMPAPRPLFRKQKTRCSRPCALQPCGSGAPETCTRKACTGAHLSGTSAARLNAHATGPSGAAFCTAVGPDSRRMCDAAAEWTSPIAAMQPVTGRQHSHVWHLPQCLTVWQVWQAPGPSSNPTTSPKRSQPHAMGPKPHPGCRSQQAARTAALHFLLHTPAPMHSTQPHTPTHLHVHEARVAVERRPALRQAQHLRPRSQPHPWDASVRCAIGLCEVGGVEGLRLD